MSEIKLYLFGTPRSERDGDHIPINRRKGLALLAYVTLQGQPQSREALATLLWPDFDQSRAFSNLRRELSRLKSDMQVDLLKADRLQVSLTPDSNFWVDVNEFRRHLAIVLDHDHHFPAEACVTCREALTEAVVLYTDRFMAGFNLPDAPAFDDWQFFEAESLSRSYGDSLLRLLRWYRGAREYDRAIDYGRRWLALDMLHEPAHRELITLYALAGQLAAALRQYEECLRLLDVELGIKPEPETTTLYEAIRMRKFPRQEDAPLAPTPVAALNLQPSERYVFEEKVAVGGQGEVFLGRDAVTGAPVTIKRLRPELVSDGSRVARFLQESELLDQLDHPNIVRMLDTFEHEGQHCIVMEFVPGGTLADRLREQGPLAPDEVLAVALEVADALIRAHHLGIIHRDLKPGNVLLSAEGKPRLTDFGMAILENADLRLTQTGMLIGSPAYMSPEALRGETLGSRSDIWSFGVILYELLAGRRPFEGENITQIVLAVLNDPVPSLASFRGDIPPPLVALIEKMLTKTPTARPPSMRQVAAALEIIQGGGIPPDLDGVVSEPRPTSLRPMPAPLIGREQELSDIRQLLTGQNTSRMLTIVGPGGIGKTLLATAVAQLLADNYRDGAAFLPLASLARAEQIVPALAAELGLEFLDVGNEQEQLLGYVGSREQLLVLDNFEHILDGAPLVEALLQRSRGIVILTTSREPLKLSAETVYRLGGLAYPDEGAPDALTLDAAGRFGAVALLLQQVQRQRPELTLGLEKMADLVRICRLVSGMPLALVLVAKWTEVLTLEEIAGEIAGNLDLLEAELRDLPPRQQSMRAVFNASWQMLDEHAKLALARLSVFSGPFSRPAAQAVAGCSLSTLRTLLDKSWLLRREHQFDMHELVRQYAAERLRSYPGASTDAQDTHAAYYAGLLQEQVERMRGPGQQKAFKEVQLAFAQAEAAWRWLVERKRPEIIVTQLLPALYRYCEGRARASELFPLLQLAWQETTGESNRQLRAILMIARGVFFTTGQPIRFESMGNYVPVDIENTTNAWRLALEEDIPTFWRIVICYSYGRIVDRDTAAKDLETMVAQLRVEGEEWLLAFGLQHLALLLMLSPRTEAGVAETVIYLSEAMAIMERLGDVCESSYTLRALGQLLMLKEELPAAIMHWREAATRLEQVGDWVLVAQLHWHIGDAYMQMGELDTAFYHFRTMSEVAIGRGNRRFAANLVSKESYEAARYGRLEHAVLTRREALALAQEVGEPFVEAWCIWEMGELYRLQGELDEATAWFERALHVFNRLDDDSGRAFYYRGLADVARARGEYERARSSYAQSQALAEKNGHDWAAAYALLGLAHTCVALGELENAARHNERALELAQVTAHRALELAALGAAAAVLVSGGDARLGLELADVVAAHPNTWQEVREMAGELSQLHAAPAQGLARRRELNVLVDEARKALANSTRLNTSAAD